MKNQPPRDWARLQVVGPLPGQHRSAIPPGSAIDPSGHGWLLSALFAVGLLVALIFQEIAWIAVALVLDFPEGTDSEAVFLGLWLAIVVTPVALLWFGHGRRRRWFAGGATAGT